MPTSASARALAARMPPPSRDGSDELRAAARSEPLRHLYFPETVGLRRIRCSPSSSSCRRRTEWRLPIIDRDPAVPLSENRSDPPYDGSHNYLSWLTQASRDDLAAQRFVGRLPGRLSPRPRRFCTCMLRHAVLAALECGGARGTLSSTVAPLFGVIDRDPLIANIGDVQHVQRRDYLTIDASRLGLASTPTALSDWTLGASRQPTGAPPSRLRASRRCSRPLRRSSNLPTARLERLFTEHLDLCSYRLDAWITAIYAQRLRSSGRAAKARSSISARSAGSKICGPTASDGCPDRSTRFRRRFATRRAPTLPTTSRMAAIFTRRLWRRPRPRRFCETATSPRRLRAFASVRGRSVIARECVPRWRSLDGVRAGQSIAALLGYQFERGLHEGHPGLELDQFIGLFRDRFPLLSGRLTEMTQGTKRRPRRSTKRRRWPCAR